MEVSLLVALWALAAAAQDIPIEEDEIDIPATQKPAKEDDWGFGQKEEKLTISVDDDESMHDFVADAKKKAPPPVHFHLDLAGKTPLADNYDILLSAYNEHYVVAELPVLVARDRASFQAAHPGGLVLVCEIWAEGVHQVLTEVITADRVFESAPTLVFLKSALPVAARSGQLRFLVKAGELPVPPPPPAPAPKGKAPPPPAPPPVPAPPKDLFARTTVFLRP
jgi:hypothetical protein